MTKLPFGHKISQAITTWDEVCLEIIQKKYLDCDPARFEEYLSFVRKSVDAWGEHHHILLRSVFPEFVSKQENIVILPARAHYRAHYLLAKALPSCLEAQLAFYLMSGRDDLREEIKDEEVPVLEEMYARYKKTLLGNLQVRMPDGTSKWVSKGHPDVISGELQHINAGKTSVRCIVTGKIEMLKMDDPRVTSGEWEASNKSQITVRDSTGQAMNVGVNDPRFLSGELIHVNKGTVCVRDKDGKKFRVPKEDVRIANGELVLITRGVGSRRPGANKGTLLVKDSQGHLSRVKLTDPRYLSGELVHYKKKVPNV